jgi:hypothetical protein
MKKTVIAFLLGVVTTTIIGVSGLGLASSGYFKDSGWWTASAEWAKDHGLMNGLGDGYFGGDQPVTRGQLAQVLKNLADSGAITINNSNQTAINSKGDGIISFEKYQQIQIGMTYPQVANLIGKDGVVQSTNPQETNYQWSDGKGGLLIVYTDNSDWNKSIAKVIMKKEMNLNWETPPANLPAQNSSVTLDQFNRVQMGMSQQEVLSIAGMCQSEEVDSNGNTTFMWKNSNSNSSLTVEFDPTGKVIEKIQGNLDTHNTKPNLVIPSTYYAIKTGMTYPQVVGLFGGDNGILISQRAIEPNAGSFYTWKTYDGIAIRVLFGIDGKVSSVTAEGLIR